MILLVPFCPYHFAHAFEWQSRIEETKNIGLFCIVSENFALSTIRNLLTSHVFEHRTNIGRGKEDLHIWIPPKLIGFARIPVPSLRRDRESYTPHSSG